MHLVTNKLPFTVYYRKIIVLKQNRFFLKINLGVYWSFFLLTDMQWLWNQDASRDLLLAVHPPNYIVLWNADTGTKLWKKSYAENILSFSFDPFDPSHLACKFVCIK